MAKGLYRGVFSDFTSMQHFFDRHQNHIDVISILNVNEPKSDMIYEIIYTSNKVDTVAKVQPESTNA
jgi:hypothetical protein